MQVEHQYQYLFMDELGRYVYENERMEIDWAALPFSLKYTPDGWQTMALSYERNILRHGVMRTVSVPLKFVKDGAKILRYYRYKYGYDAKLTLVIARLNTETYVHELLFNGDINFVTMLDEPSTVSVEILDGGINADLKAKMDTPFEIPINPATQILHDGLTIKQKTTFAVTDSDNFLDDPYWRYSSHLVDLNAVSQEVNPNFASTQSVKRFRTTTSGIYPSRRNSIKAKVDTTLEIDYDFTFDLSYDYSTGTTPNPALRTFMDFRKYSSDGSVFTSYFILSSATGTSNIFKTHHLVGTVSIPMLKDEEVYLHARMNVIGVTGDTTSMWDYTAGGEINYNFRTRAAATVVKGMKIEDLYDILMEKITGNIPTYRSTLLAARRDLVIISGDALRGFTDAKIKITLGQFLDGINTPLCIGLGTRYNQPILEKRNHFYDPTVAMTIGEVREFKVISAAELGCNQVSIGYEPFEYDEINGRDEFNTTVVWGFPVKRIVSEMKIVSPVRGDMYGAEFARVNYSQKKTTDNNSDNDNFFLVIEAAPRVDGYYHLSRPVFDVLTGLISPETAYNLEISPGRCMIEHSSWFRGILQKKDTLNITFQTMSKNPLLHTELGSVIIDEDSDISIGQMNPAYFSLDYITFKTTTPVNMPALLASNSFGFIKFTYKGVDYFGWIITVSIQPSDLEEKEFKVLAFANQNLNVNNNE